MLMPVSKGGKSFYRTNMDRVQGIFSGRVPPPQAHPYAESRTDGISQSKLYGPDRGHLPLHWINWK